MRDRPLRVAVVGTGYFSQFHLQAWQKIDEVDVVGLCDLDLDRARSAARRFDITNVYATLEEMLDAAAPDLVDVVTPPQSHLACVCAPARRGLPVICQKPLGQDLAMSTAIVKAAEAEGALLVVHENARWRPWFRKAADMIAEGAFGDLHAIAFRLRPGDGQGPDAYLHRQPAFREMSRFMIHETGIHTIDTFRFLFGEIVGVFARLRRINGSIAGEDAGYVIFDFENGATGLLDGNRCNDHAADDQRLTMGEMWIEGSAGTLRLDGWGRLWFRRHLGTDAEVAYDWPNDGTFGGGCVEAFQRSVARHVGGEAPLEQTARAYLRNIAIEEAIYASAESGRWQSVSPTPSANHV